MPLAVYKGKKIFFAHVPKAGGTSITLYLERRLGALSVLKWKASDGFVPGGGMITSTNHLSARDLRDMIPSDAALVFSLVRDPAARIVSEYHFQTGQSRASKLSFSTWLALMVACAKKDPRVYENHIRPQSDIVPEGAEFYLLEKDGIAQMVRRLDEVTGETCPEHQPGHDNRSKTRPEVLITRQDMALIQNYYAQDYQRFGYETSNISQLPDDKYAALRRLVARCLAPVIVWRQRLRWVSM